MLIWISYLTALFLVRASAFEGHRSWPWLLLLATGTVLMLFGFNHLHPLVVVAIWFVWCFRRNVRRLPFRASPSR